MTTKLPVPFLSSKHPTADCPPGASLHRLQPAATASSRRMPTVSTPMHVHAYPCMHVACQVLANNHCHVQRSHMHVMLRMQIHMTYWGEGSILFSWATGEGQVSTRLLPRPPSDSIQSNVQLGTHPTNLTLSGKGAAYTYQYNFNPKGKPANNYTYTSPLLHHAIVSGVCPRCAWTNGALCLETVSYAAGGKQG